LDSIPDFRFYDFRVFFLPILFPEYGIQQDYRDMQLAGQALSQARFAGTANANNEYSLHFFKVYQICKTIMVRETSRVAIFNDNEC
jgi:hypothetical protein